MRTRILLLIFTIFSAGLYAQQGWSPQSSGTTKWINDVSFVDTKSGWAVCNDGLILHTTDGNSWTAQQSNTPKHLYGVKFVSNMLGWIVGADGLILTTTNGGTNWTTQTAGVTMDLLSVFFMDLNFGWVTGKFGTVMVTEDGGLTWDLQTTPTLRDLVDIFFIDYLNGWAAGKEGTLLTSIDGGITWNSQNNPLSGSLNGINGVHFVSPQKGWAVGKVGTIMISNNGGINWSKQTTGTNFGFNDVFFFDANTGYAIGDNGMVKYTTDGGAVWQNQSTPISTLLLAIDFPVPDTGWIVGNAGQILFTHNGGVCPVPPILSQPASQSVCPGTIVTFTVVTNDTTATYQWFKNNVALPGDTTNILQIDSAGIANAGAYYCELNNGCGIAKSNGAVLSLKGQAQVTIQPVNDTALVGEKMTMKVSASGTSVGFQWFKDGVEIPNATNYKYEIDSVLLADSGYYKCRVSNVCNAVMSDSALLMVNKPIGIITIENTASLKFYPNPTRGQINIEVDNLKNEDISVIITNYSGQMIFNKHYGSTAGRIQDIIDLKDKSKGVYFLRFQSGKTILTEKIVLY